MRYVGNGVEVSAILFEYTTEGIEALNQLCGDRIGMLTKHHDPYGRGTAELGTRDENNQLVVEYVATEGDYIILFDTGELYPVKKNDFESVFSPVS